MLDPFGFQKQEREKKIKKDETERFPVFFIVKYFKNTDHMNE